MERVTARFTGPAKVQTGGTVQILVPGIPHDAITPEGRGGLAWDHTKRDFQDC